MDKDPHLSKAESEFQSIYARMQASSGGHGLYEVGGALKFIYDELIGGDFTEAQALRIIAHIITDKTSPEADEEN